MLLVAVFAVSAFKVGSYWLSSSKQQSEFEDLAAMKEQAAQQGANPEGGAQGADGNYYDAGFEDKTNG